MITPEKIIRMAEEVCTDQHIPDECQPAYDKFLATLYQAYEQLEQEVEEALY